MLGDFDFLCHRRLGKGTTFSRAVRDCEKRGLQPLRRCSEPMGTRHGPVCYTYTLVTPSPPKCNLPLTAFPYHRTVDKYRYKQEE